MRRLKISLAALAFVLTAGFTYATQANAKTDALDCSTTINTPANFDSSLCGQPGATICCYVPNTNQVFKTKRP